MQLTIKKKVGDGVLEINIDERDEKLGLSKALFYLQKDYCGLCKSDNIIWTSNKAKTKDTGDMFTYIKRICLNKDCKAQSTAGEYKDSGGLFWKEWIIWDGEKKTEKEDVDKSDIESIENIM